MISIMLDDPEPEEITISRAEIREETDVDYLCDLYEDIEDFIEYLRGQLFGFAEAGITTVSNGIARKLGYQKQALRAVERRLIELGAAVPYPPTDPRTVEISKLLSKNSVYKSIIRLYVNPDDVREDMRVHVERCKND